ncbi:MULTISPECIES: FtsB family cell division protein [Geothrix]|uniref:FtsB family cell division protein n=1 Tax=Geothrix TaxID=44675 RepID=UPI001FAC5FC2|nr:MULTISPECIES: septum formation initiator family protein [Geothrix]HJV38475.1 septum formation initiator family protein [Geothrix sp.]
MNANWLLKSSTLWGVFGASAFLSLMALLFSQGGLPELRKQEAELAATRARLLELNKRNRELLEEVQRLAAKDPELMEALARRQGYARPGETVYTFGSRGK